MDDLLPDDAGAAEEQFAERLVETMRQRWEAGEQPASEEFFCAQPWLWDRPQLALDLIYEELCLRQRFGQSIPREQLFRRFPHWQREIELLLDCHELFEPVVVPTEFPTVGERIGDFMLLAELGRGAMGRVYLAEQTSLAGRLVALKLVPWGEQEHQSLARLQHTHIVPLHAAEIDVSRRMRLLCMPYFGGAPLSSILAQLQHIPPARRSGRDLVTALEATAGPSSPALPHEHFVSDQFGQSSWVQAVCAIGICLADALAYAHSRGLVHFDVKPSNVLLAADGQPMLLDFHLARAPLAVGSMLGEGLGGTAHYMPPEQQRAMESIASGQPSPCAVDQRADVHALAALLHEALGGTAVRETRLDCSNPEVSPGLADLIAHCLAADPEQRLASAAALADDLRRHLRDLPLRSVPNRSLVERWRKWRRRQPTGLRNLLLCMSLLLTVFTVAGLAVFQHQQRLEEAEAALTLAQDQSRQRGMHDEALVLLRRGKMLALSVPFHGDLAERIAQEIEQVQQSRATERKRKGKAHLHSLADLIRGSAGLHLPAEARQTLARRCQELWAARKTIIDEYDLTSDAVAACDLLDIAQLWHDWLYGEVDPGEIVAEKDRLLGASTRRLGEVWELSSRGRAFLQQGRVDEAEAVLNRALALDPGHRWTHFLLGQCAYRQERHGEAVAAFSLCIGADPGNAVHYFNRGLARIASGDDRRAVMDLDHALRIDPRLAAAWFERGMLRARQRQFTAARSDLMKSIETGIAPSRGHVQLARLALAQGETEEARQQLEAALRHDPGHGEAKQLLQTMRR